MGRLWTHPLRSILKVVDLFLEFLIFEHLYDCSHLLFFASGDHGHAFALVLAGAEDATSQATAHVSVFGVSFIGMGFLTSLMSCECVCVCVLEGALFRSA